MTLGALAYRSAKRRRVGLKKDSTFRRAVGLWLLAIVGVPIILLVSKGLDVLAIHPISGIVVPVWTVLAYLGVAQKKPVLEEA